MRQRRSDVEQERAVHRPWDNSGLRHRVEGREIDGVDVSALQSAVVERAARRPRRRFLARAR
jgi:hypothetical protein